MDFVSDYLTKKRLAEQLRGRQQAMLGAKLDTGPIVTQGQGSAPTQVQANPWGNLAQLGTAYFAGQAGKNAGVAEEEAQAARMQALNNIMSQGQTTQAPNVPPGGDVGPVQPGQPPMAAAGQPGAGGGPGQPGGLGTGMPKMTPEVLMQLSQLGLPDQVLKKLVPDDLPLGAITQAASTPQGIAALVQTGVWTKEQGAAALDALNKAQQDASARGLTDYEDKKRIDAKYREPTYHAPRTPSEFELYKQDPEAYAKYQEARGLGKAKTGGGKGKGDPVADAEAMNTQLDEAERIVNDPKNKDMFGWGQRSVGVGLDWKSGNPGNLLPLVAGAIAGPFESEGAATLRRLGTEQSFARVKELYPASNSDIALARSLSANINQSKEAAQAYINQMRLMQAKYPKAYANERDVRGGPGQADGEGVGAGAGGWSIEE